MDVMAILTPWVNLLLVLGPLVLAEHWIHRHMFGVAYLLTEDKAQATGFYYIIFIPGVVLHEFVQYLVAGILNIKIKKMEIRPQRQDNGTIRYDFITIDKTDKIRSSIMGGTPFLIAAGFVYYISTSILDLHAIPAALGTGDLDVLWQAIRQQFNTPDFFLWFYLLFTISNGMIPTREDRDGWGLIFGAVGVLSVVFLFIGLDEFLVETLTGPVKEALDLVTVSLSIILMLDLLFIFFLGFVEDSLERYRGYRVDYGGQEPAKKPRGGREPGSNIPIPKGQPMPSVYNLTLPIPDIPDKPDARAAAAMRDAIADVGSARPPMPS